jgi:outer membrane receptor protein involved in Fe transport
LIAQVSAQPGLLNGNLGGASTTTQPTLMHPQTTLSVSVNNLLNNSRISSVSGVITSQFFGQPTSYQPGRSITLSLNSRF